MTGKHRAIGTGSPPRASVLLVDDEGPLLATTEAILSDVYDVMTASSGEEAIVLLQSRPFDVVCTDYAMGGKVTGLDVIARAGTLPYYVGKILLTGQNEIGTGGGYYVLAKPCDPRRLLEVVERAAAQAASRRRVAGAATETKRAAGELAGIRADKRPSGRLLSVDPTTEARPVLDREDRTDPDLSVNLWPRGRR